MSLDDLMLMPRFFVRYLNSKIRSDQLMYDVEHNQLYDPYSIGTNKKWLETHTTSNA